MPSLEQGVRQWSPGVGHKQKTCICNSIKHTATHWRSGTHNPKKNWWQIQRKQEIYSAHFMWKSQISILNGASRGENLYFFPVFYGNIEQGNSIGEGNSVSLTYPLYCSLYLKSGVTCFSKNIFRHTLNIDSIFTEPLGLLELLFDDSLEEQNCKHIILAKLIPKIWFQSQKPQPHL